MTPIYDVKTLVKIEKAASNTVALLKAAADKLTGLSYKVSNGMDSLAEAVYYKSGRLRTSLRKFKLSINSKYLVKMGNLAKAQAKARHEMLALRALEKVKLETEAETLEQAAQNYYRKL